MSFDLNTPTSAEHQRTRNTFVISLIVTLAFLPGTVLFAYLASQTPSWQFFVLTGLLGVAALFSGYSAYEARRNNVDEAVTVLVSTLLIVVPITSLLIKGLGGYLGIAQLIGIVIVLSLTATRKQIYWLGGLSAVASILTWVLDVFGNANRYELPYFQLAVPAMVAVILTMFIVLLARDFRNYSLRVKIIVGILATGGIALAVLSYLALTRSGQIITTISNRLEINVRLLAEEQLVNTISIEADNINQFFSDIEQTVDSLAEVRVSLQQQRNALSAGTYWDATTRLTRLSGGQYGNSKNEASSVFVPAFVTLDNAAVAELNTSAYLDFSAPQLLDANPDLLAVYYIDTRGMTRYYPNIELASVVPPDFDPTQDSYYQIATPELNPQRATRWTIPYIDPAGGGLIVTATTPIYQGNTFRGVMAADVRLLNVAQQVSTVKIGQTGYIFVLDGAGRVISMPDEGYALFGLSPTLSATDDFFDQTVLGRGPEELQPLLSRMVAGGSSINTVNINGVDTYLAYAPIESNGYSVALLVPVAEMQTAIAIAQNETQQQVQAAIRAAIITLVLLLLGAVAVSVGIGQVISTPVVRLTEAAGRIAAGDLQIQAAATTRDEIGTLAQAFNTMTGRLSESLTGLEKTVAERTSELVAANEKNLQRAHQFEAIAIVSRTISSTNDLDRLLPQIPDVINREFGFYHVGIFLLDTAREYAVLSASNSMGGKRMLERGHRLKVGEVGMVGYVTSAGKPRVALDTGADAVFFNNPDLPETRSEVALPLRSGDAIMGALDVQSTAANAFNPDDIRVLSTLADQVSIAIQNALQYEETRKALAESDAVSRQFVQRGWSRFARIRKLEGVRHTGARSMLLYRKSARDEGKGASEQEQFKPVNRGAFLSMPVKLRGEVIGTVDIRSPENRQFDQDEMDIVSAIIERSAIALESARLLAESQQAAAKERTIGEIAAKISSLSDIEALLKTTAHELGRNLPGMQIAIQLNKDNGE